MYLRSLGALALLLAAPAALAQRDLRWDRVPDSLLTLRTFPADTNAAAVVLGDIGKVSFDQEGKVVFERHQRVKILKPSAYEQWGTVVINYNEEYQDLDDVEAQTIVAGPDGKPVRSRLGRSGLFREKVRGKWKQAKFTFPALEPGAVVEYRYTLTSESPVFLPDWTFQYSEPVLWTEYRANIPDWFHYVTSLQGVLSDDLDIYESERVRGLSVGATRHRFALSNVPALREEPFMTTPDDYRMQMRFQLSSVNFPGEFSRSFLSTWAKLADMFVGREGIYARLLEPDGTVREQTNTIIAGKTDEAEKLRAVYDFVRTSIVYDGILGTDAERTPREVLHRRRGNCAEIALLLVVMLREADIEAHPAFFSTRDHGAVRPFYPIYDQFNGLFVYAKPNGGRGLFLDASDPLRPHTLLPFNWLNGQAWVAKMPGGQWVDIAGGNLRRQTAVTATLAPDGRVEGTVLASDGGYGALFRRHALRDADDEAAFVRAEVFDDLAGLVLTSQTVHDRDVADVPLRVEAAFALEGHAQAAGDLLYLNPMFAERQEENPLKLPTRAFPIDLGYARDVTYTLALTLPEGYELAERLRPRSLTLDGGGATFERAVAVDGRTLSLRTRFVLARPVYAAGQYGALQRFWGAVVDAMAEPLVLRRAAAPAPSTGGER